MCLAVPGKVVEIAAEPDAALRSGTVDFGGVRKNISLAFTPDVQVGDYVLVHVGFSLCVVDEAEAQRVFDMLDAMGDVE